MFAIRIPTSPIGQQTFAAPTLDAFLGAAARRTWAVERFERFELERDDLAYPLCAIAARAVATDTDVPGRRGVELWGVWFLGLDPATGEPAWLYDGSAGARAGAHDWIGFRASRAGRSPAELERDRATCAELRRRCHPSSSAPAPRAR